MPDQKNSALNIVFISLPSFLPSFLTNLTSSRVHTYHIHLTHALTVRVIRSKKKRCQNTGICITRYAVQRVDMYMLRDVLPCYVRRREKKRGCKRPVRSANAHFGVSPYHLAISPTAWDEDRVLTTSFCFYIVFSVNPSRMRQSMRAHQVINTVILITFSLRR